MAVQIWANMGITMMIFIAGLQTIPEELYEAAKIDGASAWSVFRNVTWPLLTPAVNTNLILNIIGSLQAWQLFLVLIGYRNGTQVLGYLIFAQAFRPNVGERHERLPAGICRRRFHRSILFGSRHWHVRAVHSAAQRKEDTGMNAAIASESPTKKQATRHINWGRIVSYAILLFFAVIYLGPLLMLLSTSLKTMPDFMKNATALPATLNFQNYRGRLGKGQLSSLPDEHNPLHGLGNGHLCRNGGVCGISHCTWLCQGRWYPTNLVCHRPVLARRVDSSVSVDVEPWGCTTILSDTSCCFW